ncbi:MAG: serine/threonine protein kinase [Polyangiaceae bacterium]|nr:serine/threonine protein kinase [Polyangiaceae bacterium]
MSMSSPVTIVVHDTDGFVSIRPTPGANASSAPAPEAGADPLIGRLIADRYRILRRIGRGGMGVVYEVEHAAIGKLLAMKLLSGDIAANPDVVRRFKREALAASRLHSPNTVQVFDYGVSDGLTFLVMELVPGESMSAVLRREGPMTFGRLAKIVVQVCNALSEAHDKGIIHRDIKPDNVMLMPGPDGAEIAKVVDFGLALLRDGDGLNEATTRGVILGTPNYMSPEQIRGDPLDGRADVYSVGALMYVALSGHHPFSGKPTEVLVKHLSQPPLPLSRRARDRNIDAAANDLVMRTLRKDPRERPASAAALRSLLVDELRCAGSSSVEALLDPVRVQRWTSLTDGPHSEKVGLATRDDVDAYERRLRKSRYGSLLVLGACAIVGTALAVGSFMAERAFDGREAEPNNTPATATYLPFGAEVTGYLGKRVDAQTGDRDFYAVDVPASDDGRDRVTLHVTPLPNMALCAVVYDRGWPEPTGRFCGGGPGKVIAPGPLSLSPGRHYIEIQQNVAAQEGGAAFVHENVSDAYRLSVGYARSGAPR